MPRADGALVVGVLPLDRLRQGGLVRGPSHVAEGEAEALAIVEAEVVAIVRVPLEGETVVRQRRDQSVAMLRLVVDDDAVEVEQDGGRHIGRNNGEGEGG